MELSPKRIFAVKKAINTFTSMDHPIGDDPEHTVADLIEDPRSADPDSYVLDDHTKDLLHKGMNAISEREQKILKMRYGLDEGTPMTLKEIGDQLGLTRERIRQIEGEALKKLYEAMTGEAPA
jgi:RNA polymerase primary sigma factor